MNQGTQKTTPLTMWVIHVAFMLAVPIYAYIYTDFMLPQNHPPLPEALPSLQENFLPWILIFISLFNIPLGLVLPMLAARGRMGASAEAAPSPLQLAQLKLILSNAPFEAIAIYGLIGVYMAMPVRWSYALMALSFLMLALNTVRVVQATSGVEIERPR